MRPTCPPTCSRLPLPRFYSPHFAYQFSYRACLVLMGNMIRNGRSNEDKGTMGSIKGPAGKVPGGAIRVRRIRDET